jgi:L-threonylcarbamoyladenylate synthase
VLDEFGSDLMILDGGDCDVGIESTIVDCTRGVPVLLRPGALTLQQLAEACGEPLYLPEEMTAVQGTSPKASGTLASHYAPRAKVRIVSLTEMMACKAKQNQASQIALYELPTTPEAAAHELFAKLRALDASGIIEIWITQPPEGEAWDGVRDRLNRAAA